MHSLVYYCNPGNCLSGGVSCQLRIMSIYSFSFIWLILYVSSLKETFASVLNYTPGESNSKMTHVFNSATPDVILNNEDEITDKAETHAKLLQYEETLIPFSNVLNNTRNQIRHNISDDLNSYRLLSTEYYTDNDPDFEDMSVFDLNDLNNTYPKPPWNADISTSAYRFTFSGNYVAYRTFPQLPNTTIPGIQNYTNSLSHSPLIMYDSGKIFSSLFSRQSSVQSVKLVSIQIELVSSQNLGRQTFRLSGLDFRDVKTLSFHGSATRSELNLSTESESQSANSSYFLSLPLLQQPPTAPLRCTLLGTLLFDKINSDSLSVQSLEEQSPRLSDGNWGFNDSFFQVATTTETHRQLTDNNDFIDLGEISDPLLFKKKENNSLIFESNISTSDTTKEPLPYRPHLNTDFQSQRQVHPMYQTSIVNKMMRDLSGVIVSPDCMMRLVMVSDEINLIVLRNRVIRFSLFFAFKNLLELHFLLAQIRYTESATSSPLKVSFFSLGLHCVVDCFEAIIFLKEAVSSNFMPAAFFMLTTLKIIFIGFVELRYMMIILKTRYPEPESVREITCHIKLHVTGTMFLLFFVTRLLSIIPESIGILFLFWIPQIAFDAWKGYRRSLCLKYIFGMSSCRLFFPLYMWGCPNSIFNGEIFKALPGAPSWTVCSCIIFIVGIQVIALSIQRLMGPRYFIPLSLLPDGYNYYRAVTKLTDIEKGIDCHGCFECVICMTEISYIERTLVTTPCDHHFHQTCLQQWMEVKLECPTCRGLLPPFP